MMYKIINYYKIKEVKVKFQHTDSCANPSLNPMNSTPDLTTTLRTTD